MAIVSPSILSADFGKLGADCRMVLDAGAQMLHYDVMDGHFVPNISFGVPVLKSLHKALPDAFYDVHLMISHPLQYAEPFIKAGATLYNFHLECEDDIQATLDAVKALGCKTGLTINIAINYGGRPEIVRAAQSLAAKVAAGEMKPEDITEEALSAQMYTAGQKDPDFILRPSGEKRLSNFMLWQAAYSELVEMDVLWPDFTRDDLDAAIMEFNRRSRRFGGL